MRIYFSGIRHNNCRFPLSNNKGYAGGLRQYRHWMRKDRFRFPHWICEEFGYAIFKFHPFTFDDFLIEIHSIEGTTIYAIITYHCRYFLKRARNLVLFPFTEKYSIVTKFYCKIKKAVLRRNLSKHSRPLRAFSTWNIIQWLVPIGMYLATSNFVIPFIFLRHLLKNV